MSLYRQTGDYGRGKHRHHSSVRSGPSASWFWKSFGAAPGTACCNPAGHETGAIGSCHSINREYHMALINNIYGPDSAEARGSLSIYIVGGMVGTIYFGLMASVVGMTGWFHPQALGLGSGVGAGIMMASSSASLCAIYPEWTDTISAMASVVKPLPESRACILPCLSPYP